VHIRDTGRGGHAESAGTGSEAPLSVSTRR
jgi:hypothetical protein